MEAGKSIEVSFLALFLTKHLHWPMESAGLWLGAMSSVLALAFVGGFIGDRTFKRKGWVAVGLILEGIGLLLMATTITPAVKAGILLGAVGIMLFRGNILVLVGEIAAAAGVMLELAFALVFLTITVAGSVLLPAAGLLMDRGVLFETQVFVLGLPMIVGGLFWLLERRYALAYYLLFSGSVFIFAGIATIGCTLVSNRWRGTLTTLFAVVPNTTSLMISKWQSWPLAIPLMAIGAGIILFSGLWHLLVVRRFAAGLVAPEKLVSG